MAINEISGLKGTRSEKNLWAALGGESQAYLRYIWYQSKAIDDGMVEIGEMFEKTANNEKEHAEIWYKYLGGIGTTAENLKVAASGEHFEWSTMYEEYAAVAEEEGFKGLADSFRKVASIERRHEERYLSYLKKVEDNTLLTSDSESTVWICLNCGFTYIGKNPPEMCPTCHYPKGYFTKSGD